MRVVICWPTISGYMAACWRCLAQKPGVDLFVLAWSAGESAADNPFSADVMHGIPARLLTPPERDDFALVAQLVSDHQPQVVVIPGWSIKAYNRLVDDPRLRHCRFVMTMDTPWLGTWKQQLAPLVLRRFLHRMDGVMVAGERAWQYARRLGFSEAGIFRGVYGVDYDTFAPALAARLRLTGGWPRRFLYVGRYVPQKGLDVLLDGYQQYRNAVSDPWPLTCCGAGPLAPMLKNIDGVENQGFIQPNRQVDIYTRSGVFVLPSLFDPWGVVVGEAASSGLPLICSESVGAALDLLRHQYNGLLLPTGDRNAVRQALLWMHRHWESLHEIGGRSQSFAQAYSAQMWTSRWLAALQSGKGGVETVS